MHTLSKEVLSSDDMTFANGEVQTNEEAQVHAFVTVQILDDTPAVLSLGKLCGELGYICEWASGQKLRLTKQGKKILCKTEKCRASCCRWIVVKFWH